MARFTAISVERFRADAKTQRSLGLKVGGTGTKFLCRDSETGTEGYVTSYGATPGERKTAALTQFKAGVCDNGTKPTVSESLASIRARTDRAFAEFDAMIAGAERGDL